MAFRNCISGRAMDSDNLGALVRADAPHAAGSPFAFITSGNVERNRMAKDSSRGRFVRWLVRLQFCSRNGPPATKLLWTVSFRPYTKSCESSPDDTSGKSEYDRYCGQ